MPKKIRQIRVEGNIAYVPLTKGFEAIVDVSDVEELSSWNWHVLQDGSRLYAARNVPKNEQGKRGSIRMHRYLLNHNAGLEVDHLDGNGLNNRRENLRLATKSQNQFNRKTSVLSTTGMKGVSPYRRDGTWHARISVGGKRICLGYYKTPEDAHDAYVSASKKLHGSFSRTK